MAVLFDLIESDVSLQHLQAELARIDVQIQEAVWRWRLAGQDPADTFRGLYISDIEVDRLLDRPFGSNWGYLADLPPEELQLMAEVETQAAAQAQALVDQGRAQGRIPRLAQLVATFGLDQFELDVLLICLAPTLDLRYERVYGYLQDDVTRRRPTVNLALDLLGEVGPARLQKLVHFTGDAPLRRYQMLEFGGESGNNVLLLNQVLHVDETIVAWLLGNYQP